MGNLGLQFLIGFAIFVAGRYVGRALDHFEPWLWTRAVRLAHGWLAWAKTRQGQERIGYVTPHAVGAALWAWFVAVNDGIPYGVATAFGYLVPLVLIDAGSRGRALLGASLVLYSIALGGLRAATHGLTPDWIGALSGLAALGALIVGVSARRALLPPPTGRRPS